MRILKKLFCSEEYKKILKVSENIKSCPKVPLPQIDDNQNYIFISYSHKDFKNVYSDLADMYESGVRFWYDSGLSAGKRWDEEVYEKITSPYCVGVIFYMSENLFLSASANREIEITKRRNTDKESQNTINYFGVNLTDNLPIDILSSAIRSDTDHKLDMKQISILSHSFPDNSTYICYDTPNHTEELISQIRNQFGVIKETKEPEPFDIDYNSCDVFIASFENLSSDERQRTAYNLMNYLEEYGFSVYIMQELQRSSLRDNEKHLMEQYIKKQNSIKLESSKHIIIISSTLGWSIAKRIFVDLGQDITKTQNILYLIDDSTTDINSFIHFYKFDTQSPNYKELTDNIFFLNDYKEKLLKALTN